MLQNECPTAQHMKALHHGRKKENPVTGGSVSSSTQCLRRAHAWIERAKKDYRGYTRVVGSGYLRSKDTLPEDPALAVYLLQQALEKTAKGVTAVFLGLGDHELRRYNHDFLTAQLDVFRRMADVPEMEPALSAIDRGLAARGHKRLGWSEASTSMNNLRDKVDLRKRGQAESAVKELSLLPPEAVGPVVTALGDLRSLMQRGLRRFLKSDIVVDPGAFKAYLLEPTDANFQMAVGQAVRIREAPLAASTVAMDVLDALGQGNARQWIVKAIDEGLSGRNRRLKVASRKDVEALVMGAFALCALMMLAAFTYGHEACSRYPDSDRGAAELDCNSYTDRLGVVVHLRQIGALTRTSIGDLEKYLAIVAAFQSEAQDRDSRVPSFVQPKV